MVTQLRLVQIHQLKAVLKPLLRVIIDMLNGALGGAVVGALLGGFGTAISDSCEI